MSSRLIVDREYGSSPLTRGARKRALFSKASSRIIPAHAGSTSRVRNSSTMVTDHPRSRGEHSPVPGATLSRGGSSPLTRGARTVYEIDWPYRRIIPAHAGSTAMFWSFRVRRPDHPRSRGEHLHLAALAVPRTGSSPLTRGAPLDRMVNVNEVRIIPAHAGSTPRSSTRRWGGADHPRSRGEHASREYSSPFLNGSSPLTRGARRRPHSEAIARRIIPAHAGSTESIEDRSVHRSDHPRSRGEHKQSHLWTGKHAGSSPLTRGARTHG